MNIKASYSRRATIGVSILLAALLLAGCAESSRPVATGKGKVRGINAVVTSPELIFRNEERAMGNINYREISGFSEWDDLSYNFNFDIIRPGATDSERLATEFIDVQADFEYSIVLTGTLANPSVMSWEAEEREWDGTETVFEVDFVHVSPLLGQVDVYFDLEGTVPVLGNEIGTLNNGERIPYMELAEGTYELIVTAPGDPATIIFQSSALQRLPAERVTFMLFDTDASIVSPIGVNIIFEGGAAQGLTDINSLPLLRLTHASFGVGNIDGYFNDDFGAAVFSDVAFDQSSPYVEFSETTLPVDITPAGDPATVLVEGEIQRINNKRRSMIFWGAPGAHSIRVLEHDARPVEVFPVARITNLSVNVGNLDIYIVEPGTVLDESVFPSFGGAIPGITTGFFPANEGMNEYVITVTGEKTPISTPVVFDQANGDVLDLLIVDTADPAVVEIRVFDSIP